MASQDADHIITISFAGDTLTCKPDPEPDCKKDHKVKWQKDTSVGDWVVFFSDGAPVNNKTPNEKKPTATITGTARRAEDDNPDPQKGRRVKYCVAATRSEGGGIDYLDPELIVKPSK
jgi:hypothetical protein